MRWRRLALMDVYAWGVPKEKKAMTKIDETTRAHRRLKARTIEFKAIEFETAHEAIQWTEADLPVRCTQTGGRGVAVLVDGKNFVVDRAEADRLAAAGVEFAYLCDHEMPDGEHRIITVPVN